MLVLASARPFQYWLGLASIGLAGWLARAGTAGAVS